LAARDGAVFAVLADPIFEAAALARRWPLWAAAVGKQLRGTRAEPAALQKALAFPGREALLAGQLAAALVFRSTDGGNLWARVLAPEPPLTAALRESVQRQRAGHLELLP